VNGRTGNDFHSSFVSIRCGHDFFQFHGQHSDRAAAFPSAAVDEEETIGEVPIQSVTATLDQGDSR
jgi:hypothetical protein